MDKNNSDLRSNVSDESEDYSAYLLRERKEEAKHYLKPYHKRFLLCLMILAAGIAVAVAANVGLGMLLAFPPAVYMRAIYATAYSPGQMGISRGQTFRVLFFGVPLAACYFAVAAAFL